MSFTIEDIDKLIFEKENELEGLKAAKLALSGLTKVQDKNEQREMSSVVNDTSMINLNDLKIESGSSSMKATLKDEIQAIALRFGHQEFTVNHVKAALEQAGKATGAKNFKNRVTMLVTKLTNEKIFTRTYEGKGKDPHKYKIASELSR